MCRQASSPRLHPSSLGSSTKSTRAWAKFHEAEKLSRVPFPTPYGIMMHVLMAVHTLITPPMMISVVGSNYQSALCAGIFIFVLWSVHLLAGVLENPFNSGSWDIDLEQLQRELNEKLTLACAVPSGGCPFSLDANRDACRTKGCRHLGPPEMQSDIRQE